MQYAETSLSTRSSSSRDRRVRAPDDVAQASAGDGTARSTCSSARARRRRPLSDASSLLPRRQAPDGTGFIPRRARRRPVGAPLQEREGAVGKPLTRSSGRQNGQLAQARRGWRQRLAEPSKSASCPASVDGTRSRAAAVAPRRLGLASVDPQDNGRLPPIELERGGRVAVAAPRGRDVRAPSRSASRRSTRAGRSSGR